MNSNRPADNSNAPNVPTEPAARGPQGWKKWLFRLIAAIGAPALLFALTEIILRASGYGYAPEFLIPRVAEGRSIYAENVDFSKRYFPAALAVRSPTMLVPRDKTANTLRVFVLGESAAMGFPDPSVSFPRILEVMLREAYPQVRVEVINTAFTAINSHVVLDIARECAKLQPDVFIVHVGNNEVVGPFGAAGVIGGYAPSRALIRANLSVKRYRTGQFLNAGIAALSKASSTSARRWDGMELFADSEVRVDDPRLDVMRSNFQTNLRAICHVGRDAGAEVFVCTIPVNLRNCAPFKSLHRVDIRDAELQAWTDLVEAGKRAAKNREWPEAVKHYVEALKLDDQFAELHARLGHGYLALDERDLAREHFSLARDLDALRFRTDSALNKIIRQSAQQLGPHVHLVDAATGFQEASENYIPGNDLFLEHVHMNFSGNFVMATLLFQAITPKMPTRVVGAEAADVLPQPLDATACSERLAYGPWSELKTALTIRGMLYGRPFTQQYDVDRTAAAWDQQIKALRAQQTPKNWKTATAQFDRVLAARPDDWMTRETYAGLLADAGNFPAAAEQARQVVQIVPHHYGMHVQLAKLWSQLGNPTRALTHLEKALAMVPDLAVAHRERARVLAAEGNYEQAVAIMRRQVDVETDRAEALAMLADFLIGNGKLDQAQDTLRNALVEFPNSASLQIVRGNLLLDRGDRAAAIEHYETALRLRPTETPRLGEFLAKLKREAETDGKP